MDVVFALGYRRWEALICAFQSRVVPPYSRPKTPIPLVIMTEVTEKMCLWLVWRVERRTTVLERRMALGRLRVLLSSPRGTSNTNSRWCQTQLSGSGPKNQCVYETMWIKAHNDKSVVRRGTHRQQARVASHNPTALH